MSTELVTLEGPPPKGYADGRIGHGAVLHVAGQIGWKQGVFEAKDMLGQFAQALDNVLAVVAAAKGRPTDLAQMTIYVTDLQAYRTLRKQLGQVWRERLGTHYPAMALVGTPMLVEPDALIEIQAVAYLGE